MPSAAPTLARNTGRSRSSRWRRSVIEPSKRTSPRSRKKVWSASVMARLTLCSTRMTVAPSAFTRRTMSIRRSTVMGASPKASSSIMSRRGLGHHHPRQCQHLLLATRQGAGGLVESIRQLGEEADGIVERGACPGGVASEGVLADAQVVLHREPGERHLPAHEQRGSEVDDLLGLEIGAVGPEDADDAAVRVVEARHGPQQRALAGAVGAEQRHDVAFGDLQVDVEQHLLRPVEEVHVVDLERRDGAPGLASLAFGVALEHVLDDERDVVAHETRADEQQHASHRAHRADQCRARW